MKRKSILLVLCIGMILTSCESKISLNSTDVKNEKNQKNTTMENPDKGYNLPIDEDKKKEVVNDCEEIMGIVRDIYSEYNGIQEADQNTAEQMMNRMKEIIKQNGNPVIGSDHYSVMDNYQKMEQFLKSAEQEEKGSVILYEADTDGGITRKEYSYDGKEMSVMSAKMIWSEDTEPVLTYISLSKIKEWAYTENGNFCYELCVPEPPEVTEIVDGSCIIRVKPLSEECREYSKKYVSTFGYQGNNLLCSNWNAEDMQGLDYNGLYEYFYQMKYGEKFTADDVRFTIDRLKDSDTIYSANVAHVIKVETVDNSTVKIILDQEVPFFEYNLTFPILSSKYYSDKEFTPNIVPLGTGMYKVTEVQSSAIILEKNEYYWKTDEKLTLEKITINLYSTAGELYNAFKVGNIDLVSTQNSNLSDYIGVIGYTAKEMKGREHDFIAFNTQSALVSNLNIRKAIAYSIDKSNIVSSIYGDKYYQSSFPLDYGSWVYKEQDSSSGYNLEQAKQILVDDGWNYKYKYWQKTVNYKTQRITLNFVVKSTDTTRVSVAENIKTQLENQGIRINIIKANNEQYNSYLQNKNYDMILCSMNLSISPDLSTFFGDNNLANYSNDEVKNLINEAKNTTDENTLVNKYKRLAEIYKEDVPYISLYTNKHTVAYNSALVGTIEPNWFNPYNGIETWYK